MRSSTLLSVLRADGVSHAYGDRVVLTDISLVASGGRRIGLLGENGAGKSTLLRLLAGVEDPDSGAIERPARTALLAQEVRFDSDAPLGAIIEDAVADLRALDHELQDAAAALAGGPAAAS